MNCTLMPAKSERNSAASVSAPAPGLLHAARAARPSVARPTPTGAKSPMLAPPSPAPSRCRATLGRCGHQSELVQAHLAGSAEKLVLKARASRPGGVAHRSHGGLLV